MFESVNLILKTNNLATTTTTTTTPVIMQPTVTQSLSVYKQLLIDKKPWGRYAAESVNGNTLIELGGNTSRDAVLSNITSGKLGGNGALSPITYLSGTTTSTINFTVGSIPPTFTICSIARYSGNKSNRILASTNGYNFLHGHWSSKRGLCYYNNFVTPESSIGTLRNWLNCCGTNSTTNNIPGNILLDGIASGINTGLITPINTSLGINFFVNETSNFDFSQLLIFDQALTASEMIIVSDALKNYLRTGVLDTPTEIFCIPTSSIFTSNNLVISNNTNPIANGTYIASSSSDQGGNWFSWQVFNGITNDSIWISRSGAYSTIGEQMLNVSTIVSNVAYLGEWVQIKLPSAIILSKYGLLGRVGGQYSYPKKWYVVGSNDGNVWYLLDTQNISNVSYWSNANTTVTPINFVMSSTSSYLYYRIIINSINNTNADYAGVGQFYLISSNNTSSTLVGTPPNTPIPVVDIIKTLLWEVNMEMLLGNMYNQYTRFNISLNYISGLTTDNTSKNVLVNLSGLPFTNVYNLGGKNNSLITVASLLLNSNTRLQNYFTPQYYQFTQQKNVYILINLNNLEDGINCDSLIDHCIFSFNIIGDKNFKINI